MEPRGQHVDAGDLERAGRRVDRRDLCAGMLVRNGERDRAASGPDVEHTRLFDSVETSESALYHDLRLRPRNEHAPVDLQREPPESPLTQHVRERLTFLPPCDERLERMALVTRELALRLECELRARRSEHMRDEDLGVHAR